MHCESLKKIMPRKCYIMQCRILHVQAHQIMRPAIIILAVGSEVAVLVSVFLLVLNKPHFNVDSDGGN